MQAARHERRRWDDQVSDSPTEHERLLATREHADRSLREMATAYLRSQSKDPEGLDAMTTMAYMALTANFLALIEAPDLNLRSMLARRNEIMRRYIDQARVSPTHP